MGTVSKTLFHSLHVTPHSEPYTPSLALDLPHRRQGLEASHFFFRGRLCVDDAEDAMGDTHVVQVATHEQLSALDDADGVGDGLYVGEEVGGEEDGSPLGRYLADEDLEEGAAGDGVEAGCWLVEY